MLHEMFVVFDSAVNAYTLPLYFRSPGEALRWFELEINSTQSRFGFNQSPKDYTLFHVGNYDDNLCKVELLAAPVSLGCAIQYVKSRVADPAPGFSRTDAN